MNTDILQVKRSGDFYYPIVYRHDFRDLCQQLKSGSLDGRKYCVVTDSHVADIYLEDVLKELRDGGFYAISHILPAGEENKTLQNIQGIYETLIQNHFDRKDILLALGGGVVGDMTGFAAATYLRGIDFVQIPTTLLAQVDSSIGGKTGVDFLKYKNMVGAFHQPRLVYTNVNTLKTLSEEQFSCGMGEVIKHGFIKDMSYLKWLEENREDILSLQPDILQDMIYQSNVIKKTVVENDPTEKGERALLNMGHTTGHAIEKLKDFQLLHGQCVAVGTVCSAYLSYNRGWISKEDYEYTKELIRSFGLPVTADGLKSQDVLAATKSDKKMEQGKIKFILMDCIGHAIIDKTVTDEEILQALEEILTETAGM